MHADFFQNDILELSTDTCAVMFFQNDILHILKIASATP